MRALLLVLLLGLAGCAPKAPPTFDADSAAPCPIPIAAARAGDSWRQVTADGFAFCVPASWRTTAANTLRGEGGWIRWGVGEYRPTATRSVTVAVPAGQGPPVMPGRQHQFSEVIGGGLAEMWDNELNGTLYTGAKWVEPRRVYLLGQSTSHTARATQLQIYRTVRFAVE